MLHPGTCCDLDFTLQYLSPGSLGPSLAAGFWDVFHQCKWSHFSTCIVELIPTWSLICSTFPKFQRVIRHRDIIEPILDPCHLGTIEVSKQEWYFQTQCLLQSLDPHCCCQLSTLTQTKCYLGGIKVDKKAKGEEEIWVSASLDARALINNASPNISLSFPFLVPCGWSGCYDLTSLANESWVGMTGSDVCLSVAEHWLSGVRLSRRALCFWRDELSSSKF